MALIATSRLMAVSRPEVDRCPWRRGRFRARAGSGRGAAPRRPPRAPRARPAAAAPGRLRAGGRSTAGGGRGRSGGGAGGRGLRLGALGVHQPPQARGRRRGRCCRCAPDGGTRPWPATSRPRCSSWVPRVYKSLSTVALGLRPLSSAKRCSKLSSSRAGIGAHRALRSWVRATAAAEAAARHHRSSAPPPLRSTAPGSQAQGPRLTARAATGRAQRCQSPRLPQSARICACNRHNPIQKPRQYR